MATRTITRNWRVENVLTDVTTATLDDPTSTYGIKRNDTDAVVVAAGTAMTHVSTGVYSYEFTEPADGLAYTAYVKFVHDNHVYRFEHDLPVVSTTEIGVTYSSLKEAIGFEAGYWSYTDGWTIASANHPADLDAIIKSGLRRVYLPAPIPPATTGHQWSFLYPLNTLTLESGVSLYDLPSDFGGLHGPLNYAPDESVLYAPIKIKPEREVQQKLAAHTSAGRPTIAAIRAKAADYATGTRYEILFYPTPDDAYDIQYRYRVGLLMLSDANPIPPGGNEIAGLVTEACLAEAEIAIKGEEGPHSRRFPEMLAAAISHDQALNSPGTLGFDRGGNGSIYVDDRWRQNQTVAYNGIEY